MEGMENENVDEMTTRGGRVRELVVAEEKGKREKKGKRKDGRDNQSASG